MMHMFMKRLFLAAAALVLASALVLGGDAPVSPELAKLEVEKAKAAEQTRDYETALAHYRNALVEDPGCVEAIAGVGSCHFRRNELDEAEKWFRKAMEADPLSPDYPISVWDVLLERVKGDKEREPKVKEQIVSELDAMLAKAGDDITEPISYVEIICANYLLEDKERSAKATERYVTKFKKSNKERFAEIAQAGFEDILAQPGVKRLEPSKKFVELFPSCPQRDTCFRIVISYLSGLGDPGTKDLPQMTKYCELWTKSDPENPMALIKSAWAYIEFDMDYDAAEAWLKKSLPVLEEREKAELPFWEQEWMFRDVMKASDALQLLGYANLKKGDLVSARKWLDASLAKSPFNDTTFYYLAKVYETTGNYEKAFDNYWESMRCRGSEKKALTGLTRTANQLFGSVEANEVRGMVAGWKGVPGFTDATASAGLGAKDKNGKFVRAGGGRVAWGDYDNDGWQDLLVNGYLLWHNNGDGTFTDASAGSGINEGYGGGIWADVNNDGCLDFFGFGGAEGVWLGDGTGKFAKSPANVSDNFPTEGAGVGDYDRDGFVDVYCANYEQGGLGSGTPDKLWHNINGKEWEEVSEKAGAVVLDPFCGRGVSWCDYDMDGWNDIFVSNYRLNPNLFWRNNGDGTFANVARKTGVEGTPNKGAFGHTIGSDWADYDNDGDWDLFEANLAHPRYIEFSNMSYLLESSGAPDYTFKDKREGSGIRYEETHSNPAWCDYDNDGFQDLYITSVYEKVPSFLYRNKDGAHFEDMTWETGTRVLNGWGSAWGDYDNDGDMDLVVSGGGQLYLFKNGCPKERHWLEVRLEGKDCNRAAIGARVSVYAGGVSMMRQVEGGSGTGCQDSMTLHFGLGGTKGSVECEVVWPCGKRQKFTAEADSIANVKEE